MEAYAEVNASVPGWPKRAEGIWVQPFSSSSRKHTFLVWLPSGRVLEVSKAVADMLALMDGHKSVAEIAEILSSAGPGRIRAKEVENVIERRLVPAGLVLPDAGAGQGRGTRSEERPCGTRGIVLFSARCLRPLTLRLQVLFSPPVRVPLLVLALLCAWILLGELFVSGRGIGPGRLSSRETACLYGLLLVSVLFHELGHLSALRFHGGEHGEVRMGLYIVFPVLYANVNRAWGLSRKARVDVDLGGVYFQFLLAIPCLAAYWSSSSLVWPSLCAGILSMVVMAMNPFFRFDGYWLCSDILGVPNLRERSRRYLKQVWSRLRRGWSKGPLEETDLGRVEAAGLFLYGILSHAFFIAAAVLLVRFVFVRPGHFVAILAEGPVRVLEAVRSGDLWRGLALVPVTAAGYAAAYGMSRLAWQGVRVCVGVMRTSMRNLVRGVLPRGGQSGLRGVRRSIGFFLAALSLLGWGIPACGGSGIAQDRTASEGESPGAEPVQESVSCKDLEGKLEEATGGNFACLYCMRSWHWQVPADGGVLMMYVEYRVEDASEEISLRFLRPDGSLLWERRALKGDQGAACLTDEEPQEGLYELSLTGAGPFFGLLQYFRGSVWARVGSERMGFLDSLRSEPNKKGQGLSQAARFPQ